MVWTWTEEGQWRSAEGCWGCTCQVGEAEEDTRTWGEDAEDRAGCPLVDIDGCAVQIPLRMIVLSICKTKKEGKKETNTLPQIWPVAYKFLLFFVSDRAIYWGGFVSCASSTEPPAAAQPFTVAMPAGGSGENFQTLKAAKQHPLPVIIFRIKTCERKLFFSPRIMCA